MLGFLFEMFLFLEVGLYCYKCGKCKKIVIISSIFSDHNAMRLDINYRKKSVKNTNTWRLHNTLLNNEVITEEVKGEIKKYLETNDNGDTMTQNLWDAAKAVLRGKFIAIQSYLKKQQRASLVVQWLRISLPMQGTRARALVWEDPTCHGATGPVSHNY